MTGGKTMKKWYKTIVVAASIGVFLLAAIPLVSGSVGEGESYTAIMRIYNLMEFSPWGIIPLMAPLLIPFILFGKQSQTAKEAELLLLLVGNMVAYVHSFYLAVDWLRSEATSLLTYHMGWLLCPICFMYLLVYAKKWYAEYENEEAVEE